MTKEDGGKLSKGAVNGDGGESDTLGTDSKVSLPLLRPLKQVKN